MSRRSDLEDELRSAGDRRDWDECDRIEAELDALDAPYFTRREPEPLAKMPLWKRALGRLYRRD